MEQAWRQGGGNRGAARRQGVHCRQQGSLLTLRPRGLLLPLSVAAQVDGDVDSEEEEEEGMGDIDVEKVATLEV